MSRRWILLDFDNTLMHTDMVLPSLIERFNTLYHNQIQTPLTLDIFLNNFQGQARESLCESMSKHFNISVSYEDLYKNREEYIQEFLKKNKVPMAPHLLEALKTLKIQGYKFAVVTNNPSSRAKCAMENSECGQGRELLGLIENIFEAGNMQKPDPWPYNQAINILGTSSDMCVAVEDSTTGARSAIAAGIKTYGYTYYGSHPQALLDMGVTQTFDDWRDFPSLLS
jgi:HAD superfamily hydrolase (TIGR01509 family)